MNKEIKKEIGELDWLMNPDFVYTSIKIYKNH